MTDENETPFFESSICHSEFTDHEIIEQLDVTLEEFSEMENVILDSFDDVSD